MAQESCLMTCFRIDGVEPKGRTAAMSIFICPELIHLCLHYVYTSRLFHVHWVTVTNETRMNAAYLRIWYEAVVSFLRSNLPYSCRNLTIMQNRHQNSHEPSRDSKQIPAVYKSVNSLLDKCACCHSGMTESTNGMLWLRASAFTCATFRIPNYSNAIT